MTDMLKEAESKVVDVIVKKTTTKAKATKQFKIKTKTTNRTEEATVPKKTNTKTKPTIQSKIKTATKDTVEEKIVPNDYLKMCNAKQKKNHEKLASIAEEMR